jgi:hypothetical protein
MAAASRLSATILSAATGLPAPIADDSIRSGGNAFRKNAMQRDISAMAANLVRAATGKPFDELGSFTACYTFILVNWHPIPSLSKYNCVIKGLTRH